MIGIIYFSGTGNSRWIARSCQKELTKQRVEVVCISVEEGEDRVRKAFEDSDKLIVVYPVYGSDMPKILKRSLLKLNSDRMKETMLLCTQLSFSGDANVYLAKLLKKNGIDVVIDGEFPMANNLCTPIFIKKPMSGEELVENLRESRGKVDRLIKEFLHGERDIRRLTLGDRLGGTSQRVFFNSGYPFYRRLFTTNERCTKCGYCEKICPSRGVSVDHRGVKWNKKCIFCARCYNYCPVDGINMMKATEDRDRFERYKGPEGRCDAVEK